MSLNRPPFARRQRQSDDLTRLVPMISIRSSKVCLKGYRSAPVRASGPAILSERPQPHRRAPAAPVARATVEDAGADGAAAEARAGVRQVPGAEFVPVAAD